MWTKNVIQNLGSGIMNNHIGSSHIEATRENHKSKSRKPCMNISDFVGTSNIVVLGANIFSENINPLVVSTCNHQLQGLLS